MHAYRLVSACLLAMALGLSGCTATPKPSHGADNTPSGVSVYGTVDVGIGKSR